MNTIGSFTWANQKAAFWILQTSTKVTNRMILNQLMRSTEGPKLECCLIMNKKHLPGDIIAASLRLQTQLSSCYRITSVGCEKRDKTDQNIWRCNANRKFKHNPKKLTKCHKVSKHIRLPQRALDLPFSRLKAKIYLATNGSRVSFYNL